MTQKEKLMKAFLAIQSIKHTAQNIETECSKYSSTACSYAKDIYQECEKILKVLNG